MAKTAAKATKEKEAPKKAVAKATSKAKPALEKVAQDTLDKLKTLNLDAQVQSELEWCIGSYLHDQNPVGLIQSLQRSAAVLKTALAKKTKGVTAKFVTDLEQAIG